MSGTISNGLSGLLAAQRALQTTSNNIANANTAGYVRQRTEFSAIPGTPSGRYTIGAGVTVSDITRSYDQFLGENLRSSSSLEQRYAVFGDFANRLDSILGNPDTGLSSAVQRFFNQVEVVGRDPTSIAQRQQLLLEGDSLATRFQQVDGQLNGLGEEVDGRLRNAVAEINQLAGQIAAVNGEIVEAGQTASPALFDQRNELLKRLGAQIDVNTVDQADGGLTVIVGSGQTLVLGNRALQLTTVPNTFNATRLELALDNGGSVQTISTKVNGGVVGGLLAFRNDVLDDATRDIGQLAAGLADVFNTQHRQGVDLTGNLGTDFFGATVPSPGAGARTNTGSASVSASIVATGNLAGRDYELRFNGTAWSVVDAQTGAAVAATGTGAPADPLLFEGLSVTATAGGAAGDRFLIRPLANAADDFRVLLGAPGQIAAAAPLVSRIGTGNLSQAKIGTPQVTDIANPGLQSTATIRFLSPTSYEVVNGTGTVGPLPYTSGDPIAFSGWTVAVTGQPQTGDEFFVAATAAGSGDNRNAVALAGVSLTGLFAGGTQSVSDLGADIVATVGSTANRARNEGKVQEALRQQAEVDLENVSGVNLDEEAADMLRYQQAYLAASKVISIADNLFQNLLQAVR